MELLLATAVTVGLGFTKTVVALVPRQPLAPVPITEYAVVAEGVRVMLEKMDPVLHNSPEAAVAVSVTSLPLHTVVGLLIPGVNELTVTTAVLVFTQPAALVPVTL